MNGRSVRNAFKCEAWANAARKNKENDEEKEKTNKNIRGEEGEHQQPKPYLQSNRKKKMSSCRESYMISMRELSCVESRAGSSFPGSSISKSVMHSQSCQRYNLMSALGVKGDDLELDSGSMVIAIEIEPY